MPQKRHEPNPIAEVLMHTLTSPNVSDSNYEVANLVDVGDRIADALWKLARTGDSSYEKPGAIELHGEAIKDAAVTIAGALLQVAQAIRALKEPGA